MKSKTCIHRLKWTKVKITQENQCLHSTDRMDMSVSQSSRAKGRRKPCFLKWQPDLPSAEEVDSRTQWPAALCLKLGEVSTPWWRERMSMQQLVRTLVFQTKEETTLPILLKKCRLQAGRIQSLQSKLEMLGFTWHSLIASKWAGNHSSIRQRYFLVQRSRKQPLKKWQGRANRGDERRRVGVQIETAQLLPKLEFLEIGAR